MKNTLELECPAYITFNAKEEWAVEMPKSTYQGESLEALIILIVDLFIAQLDDLDNDKIIVAQIVKNSLNT